MDNVINEADIPVTTEPRKGGRGKSISRKITITAVLAALLLVGKYALQFIPWIEVVTVFVIVFTCVFGWRMTAIAVNVFCALDPIIYPMTMSFPSIIVGYFIFWNLLCGLTHLIYKAGMRWSIIWAFFALFMTALFDVVLTAANCVMTGAPFIPYYISSVVFNWIRYITNFSVLLLLYTPLRIFLTKLNGSYIR